MIVHQFLHGYSQGHTLLVSSKKLSSSKDANLIMTLSDWSEYKDPLGDDSSYITAYPLLDSDYYAIAKTWYADEMERPGCVWTHTLLFNIHDLSYNVDIRLLLGHFKRPQKDKFETYSKDIIIEDNNVLATPYWTEQTKPILDSISTIYERIIKHQTICLDVNRSSLFYQQLLMSLIRHIPPLMLKNISLCSGTAQLRRINGNPMSLQFSQSSKDDINKVAKNNLNNNWVREIAKSIVDEKQEIPTLFSIYAEEILTIDNLCAIIDIFKIVERLPLNCDDINIFREFLKTTNDGFPKPTDGMKLKATLMGKSISPAFCDESVFLYEMGITKYFSAFDYNVFNFSERISTLHKDDSSKFIDLLTKLINNSSLLNPFGELVITNSVKSITQNEITYIIKNNWTLFMCLASIDNNIFNNDSWISSSNDNDFKAALRLFDKCNPISFDYWEQLINRTLSSNSCLSKNTIHNLKKAMNNIGLVVLDYIALNSNSDICESLVVETINDDVILSWLPTKNDINAKVVSLIMKVIPPLSSKVKNGGSQIWKAFYGINDVKLPLEYYVYLFILSYNWKNDRIAFKYHLKAFYILHSAIADNRLSDYLLTNVEKFTKPLIFWNEWDKFKKLRNGLVDRMIECGYSEEILYKLTPDKELNEKLIKAYRKRA